MYCKNCGSEIPDDARFCRNCGAEVLPAGSVHSDRMKQSASDKPPIFEGTENNYQQDRPFGQSGTDAENGGRKVTENIVLCPDGKYRWVYEFQMLKNPTILITVLKVLLLSFAVVFGFMALLHVIGGDYRLWSASDYAAVFKGLLYILLGVLVLGVISYLILAAIYGWSYQVLYTMDEDGVELIQMNKEFQKSQAIGWLTAAAGLAAGNAGMVGTGILAAARNTSASVFRQVRKVKPVRRRHVIYVDQLLGHNQVYAEDADFDFVKDFIVEHCPNAKISK